MEEQLFDTDSDQQSTENVIQKLNNTKSENEYKIKRLTVIACEYQLHRPAKKRHRKNNEYN